MMEAEGASETFAHIH